VPSGVWDAEATVIINNTSIPSYPLPDARAVVRAFVIDIFDTANQPLTQFNQPLTFEIRYTDGQLNTIHEETLNLAYWNGTDWINLLPCNGCTVDGANNQITVRLNHLSEFVVTGSYVNFLPMIGQ
jgi:hypothetical protein